MCTAGTNCIPCDRFVRALPLHNWPRKATLESLTQGRVSCRNPILARPFGYSCGTPRANERLYPTTLAEMARALRPGSGRAILLVVQPSLLGLPGLRGGKRKEKKEARKQARRAGGAPRSPGRRETPGPACDVPSSVDGAQEDLKPPGGRRQCGSPTLPTDGMDGALQDTGATRRGHEPHEPTGDGEGNGEVLHHQLWKIKAQHTVNVGGLVSYVLILERTREPAPPVSDRRKRWVGTPLKGNCTRRSQHKKGDSVEDQD